jgi:hypothetical protein
MPPLIEGKSADVETIGVDRITGPDNEGPRATQGRPETTSGIILFNISIYDLGGL